MGASALMMAALQASITAPTDAFRGCLREAAAKAQADKVGGDKIEDYLRSACTVQKDALTSAIVAFRMKNGMTKKQASSDAEMTVDDYVSTPADNYRFLVNYNAPKPQPTATPAPTPAAAPQPASSQPHS
ncbi:MAG: hypothetical protein ACM3ZV_13025 [Bacillota bacterium]